MISLHTSEMKFIKNKHFPLIVQAKVIFNKTPKICPENDVISKCKPAGTNRTLSNAQNCLKAR